MTRWLGSVSLPVVRRTFAVGRVAASLVVIALVTALYTVLLRVNPTTVALSYLLVILVLASSWGIVEATTASILAVLCFNFFFLPPVGTLTIADPQNWVAFVAFLLTAAIASQMSGRAKRRETEAASRQRDLERLYALSRALLLSERGASVSGMIARYIADAFELQAVGLYDHRVDTVSWAGPTEVPAIEAKLRDVARRATIVHDSDRWIVIAIQLGGAPIGSVALLDSGLSDTVLNSIANLAAIGLERARVQEMTARAEAAQQSGELRAAVLDALAHEFKTPLTSMKAASTELLSGVAIDDRNRELATILDEEVDRLDSLVSDAVQMLRIDAGKFTVHLERHAVADLVAAALRQCEGRLDGHRVVRQVPQGLTVDADGELLKLAVRQLLDNALKYSPPSSTIEVLATGNGSITVAVRNSGSTISEQEQPRIFERFYRGARARHIPGTGLGLAIVQQIAQAHRGTVAVSSEARTGTTFTISLPKGMSTS